MRPLPLALSAALLASVLLPAAETRDPEAVVVAQRTLGAMGGGPAFERLRTLRFAFVAERDGKELARWRHAWDRWDGRYRVEGTDREGHAVLALFNIQRRGQGRAWRDGKELSGPDLATALDRAYGRFINDSYWLLMPAKMLDPGVNLAAEGTQFRDGRAYDVVRLTFQGVGLTPKDTYWAYVSRDTGLMERWEMVLTGQTAKDRAAYVWEDWRPVDGVRLSLRKRSPDGSTVVRFDGVSGSGKADDAAFAAP